MLKNIFRFLIVYIICDLGSSKRKRFQICEHATPDGKMLSCPGRNEQIYIISAVYGRISLSICGHGHHNGVTNCVAESSLPLAKHFCNGKKMCTLRASNDMFGDPCWGIVKYLDVVYKCKKTAEILGSSKRKSFQICEHATPDAKMLSCPRLNEQIHIISALYGRISLSICGHRYHNGMRHCVAASSLPTAKRLCNGKKICKLQASNDMFGDPCWGIAKYLDVVYKCKKTEIHGGWSSWSKLTKCLGGQKARKRLCNNPAPTTHGRYCFGSAIQISSCVKLRIDSVILCPLPEYIPATTLKEAVKYIVLLTNFINGTLPSLQYSINQLHRNVIDTEGGLVNIASVKRDYSQTKEILVQTLASMRNTIKSFKQSTILIDVKMREANHVEKDISKFQTYLGTLLELIKEAERKGKMLVAEKTQRLRFLSQLSTLIQDYKIYATGSDDLDLDPEMAEEERNIIDKKGFSGYQTLHRMIC